MKIIFLFFLIFFINFGNLFGEDVLRTKSISNPAEFFVIRGFIDKQVETVTTYPPVYTIDDNRFDPPSGNGYIIELQDKTGLVLAFYDFNTSMMHISTNEGDREVDSEMFHFVIPFNNLASKISIKKNGKILWDKTRSTNAPMVKFKNPVDGAKIAGIVNIEWFGYDIDRDDLFYQLELSKDNGISWQPLTVFISLTNTQQDTKNFPNAKDLILRLVCSDGFNTVRDKIKVTIDSH